MQQILQIQVSPEEASDINGGLKKIISKNSGIPEKEITHIEILKRSIDARQRKILVNLKVCIYAGENFHEHPIDKPHYKNVTDAEDVLIIGAGPAGLFAALRLIELGLKPIILERGKDVKERRRDIAVINRNQKVNPDSNYCFGEGGAGTYSDGKLYTRSTKRGDVSRILELLVAHGASRNIMVDAHPHIGTNKLPAIITAIRKTILEFGGEIHFNTRITDILLHHDSVAGVVTLKGDKIKSSKIILATGHSARDIFQLLNDKGIEIESKPFALGVRVEHPQQLIDQLQYKCKSRGEYLPPAPYSIVKQVKGRGVYSFCMCPGGIIAPCATNPDEVVTNGWSPSKRDQPYANSGIVVELKPEDFKEYKNQGALAGMAFQRMIEQSAWEKGGKTQKAPAQRLMDFISGKQSTHLPKTSYQPGINSVEMRSVFPDFIYTTLQEGFKEMGKTMKGFLTNDAVIHAPESRTSSPVRIPRDKDSFEHIRIKGLYPCGEGAGYAGGIVSAAIDGERCAEKCALSLT